jgi:hypothetical protein
MQELCNSVKRPNLQIRCIEQEEEMKAKSLGNIFSKREAENFPNFEKQMPIHVEVCSISPGYQSDMTKIEPLHGILL